jgi:hypothetical protein
VTEEAMKSTVAAEVMSVRAMIVTVRVMVGRTHGMPFAVINHVQDIS